MNERIESYLKQHLCRDYFNTYGETIEDDHYFMYREEIDGLVKLIVKECVKVLEVQGVNTGREEYHYGAHLVEEHFGVD